MADFRFITYGHMESRHFRNQLEIYAQLLGST